MNTASAERQLTFFLRTSYQPVTFREAGPQMNLRPTSLLNIFLSQAKEVQFRPAREGPGFAIPELKALYNAVSLEGDSAAVSAGADNVAHMKSFSLAVAVMDHDVIELDRSVGHANLQCAIAPRKAADFNVVMIVLTVHVGRAKKSPCFCLGRRSSVGQQCQCEYRQHQLLHLVCLSSVSERNQSAFSTCRAPKSQT